MKFFLTLLACSLLWSCGKWGDKKKDSTPNPESEVPTEAPEVTPPPKEDPRSEPPVDITETDPTVLVPFLWEITKEGSDKKSYLFATHSHNMRLDQVPQPLLEKIRNSEEYYSDRLEMNLLNQIRTTLAMLKDARVTKQLEFTEEERAKLQDILTHPTKPELSGNVDNFEYFPVYMACRDLIYRATEAHTGEFEGLLEKYASDNQVKIARLDPDLGFNLKMLRKSCSMDTLRYLINDFEAFQARATKWHKDYFSGNMISLIDERMFYSELIPESEQEALTNYHIALNEKWFEELEPSLNEKNIFISITSRALLEDENFIDFLETKGFQLNKMD